MTAQGPSGTRTELMTAAPRDAPAPAYYGDWAQVLDSFHERNGDSRWRCELLVLLRGGKIAAMTALHQSRFAGLPDARLRSALAEASPELAQVPDATRLLFIGGHAGLQGGFAVARRSDRQAVEAALTEIGGAAVAQARARQAVPIALFVPHDQVPGLVSGWYPRPDVKPGGVVSTMRVTGSSLDDFLATQPQPVRYTWRKDLEMLERLGIRAEEAPLTESLVTEAAPLIAAVKTRNGTFDTARTTQYRLLAWWRRCSGRCVAWSLRDGEGALVGVSLAEARPGTLDVAEVGLVSEHPDRVALYYELTYHAPMRHALRDGGALIDWGWGHSEPKRARGADQDLRWHLIGSI